MFGCLGYANDAIGRFYKEHLPEKSVVNWGKRYKILHDK
jgi:hypothetical protein